MANPTGKGGFQERKHQINRHGRPRNHDQVRKLIQRIGAELAIDPKTGGLADYHGNVITEVELMLRSMMKSKNSADRKEILEHGWGKVKDEQELTGKVEHVLRVIYDKPNADGATADGALAEHGAASETE